MAGKTKSISKSVSESVADLAELHDLDQVVVIGWRDKGGQYVMVAHGKDAAEQAEADAFAKRLIGSLGAPSEKTDCYYGNKKANKG
jgi:hypothetical protein